MRTRTITAAVLLTTVLLGGCARGWYDPVDCDAENLQQEPVCRHAVWQAVHWSR